MEHFFIITNIAKDPGLMLQGEIAAFLLEKGKTCDLAHERPDDKGKSPSRDVDCILVLGGDGTMLRAARENAGNDAPVLGINLGTLGYLAEIEKTNWKAALTDLINGNFEIEQRMMLSGTIDKSGTDNALNDIAITRFGALQIVPYDVYVNDQYLNTFRADGIIVSTPTGSTGYNMSAGGPIVEPSAQLILMTPICPHTLNTRSIILAADDIITIEIGRGKNGGDVQVEADFDGCGCRRIMHAGDRITIRKYSRTTRTIKLSRKSFLETLHRKMSG